MTTYLIVCWLLFFFFFLQQSLTHQGIDSTRPVTYALVSGIKTLAADLSPEMFD